MMSNKILVPVDGSEHSFRALDEACELARAMHATIVIFHVVSTAKAARLACGEPSLVAGSFDVLRQAGNAVTAEAREHACLMLPAGRIEVQTVLGEPIDEIVNAANNGSATWIVMGSHGRTGLARMLIGSVAEGVLRHASVPVMIVPRFVTQTPTVKVRQAAEAMA